MDLHGRYQETTRNRVRDTDVYHLVCADERAILCLVAPSLPLAPPVTLCCLTVGLFMLRLCNRRIGPAKVLWKAIVAVNETTAITTEWWMQTAVQKIKQHLKAAPVKSKPWIAGAILRLVAVFAPTAYMLYFLDTSFDNMALSKGAVYVLATAWTCLLYTSPSPRDS